MPHRYPLTHELKRFAVEFLCLLLVLQGFPAQALQTAQPATVEKTSEKPKTPDDGGGRTSHSHHPPGPRPALDLRPRPDARAQRLCYSPGRNSR